jgi:general secretion pathway protein J
MIGLLLVAGVTTGAQVWRRSDTREVSGETLESAQDTLRNRIEQTYPTTLYDGNPPDIDFQGGADSLAFEADPPASERPGPIRRYRLFLDTAGELVLASVSDIAPTPGPADAQVLLTGVRALEIDYFGVTRPDMQRHWRVSWRGQADLPELVRIRVAFEPSDPRVWPDLVVRPRATIDSLCRLDVVGHRCKGRA